jgi:OmpA-OmpF porin, OOP family
MEKIMARLNLPKIAYATVLWIIGIASFSTTILADSVKAEGLIKGRNGDTMILQTSDEPNLVVVLTDTTDVAQVQGMLKVRRKEMSMAALIPGLAVKVEGSYNDQHQLVAKTVRFKGNDLQRAKSIEAGMHETKAQSKQNTEELQKQESAINANKAAVDAAVARFGQLDDYYIMDELTIYFGNAKVDVDEKYIPQLLAMTEKAKTLQGYMIEVKGYASAVGNTAMNQKLSEDRANNVTNILLQQGQVPLTRMLAPGAMGESQQIGNEKTEEGQAENRRVVVRVLQNKAVAGSVAGK